MQNMLPNMSIPLRIMPRTNCERKFCTCVMSLVTRVTSEPVPMESICGKEKAIIRRKQSLRMSLPTFCPAYCTTTLFIEPQKQPRSTNPTICRPSRQIRPMSPTPPLERPSTPSSTISLMRLGCRRSMHTSPTMKSAPSTPRGMYLRTYFHIMRRRPPFGACRRADRGRAGSNPESRRGTGSASPR